MSPGSLWHRKGDLGWDLGRWRLLVGGGAGACGAAQTQTSVWLVPLHSPGNNSQGCPSRARCGAVHRRSDASPVLAGLVGDRGAEGRTAGWCPHFSVTRGGLWCRRGSTGVRNTPLQRSPVFPSAPPIAGPSSEERRASCCRWAGPNKKGFSLQMTQRPELSGLGPPSQRSSWKR